MGCAGFPRVRIECRCLRQPVEPVEHIATDLTTSAAASTTAEAVASSTRSLNGLVEIEVEHGRVFQQHPLACVLGPTRGCGREVGRACSYTSTVVPARCAAG